METVVSGEKQLNLSAFEQKLLKLLLLYLN